MLFSNTKLLVFFSILIIAFGLGFIWYGLAGNTGSDLVSSPSPTEVLMSPSISPQIASDSAAIAGIEGEKASVTRVVDGDTIDVSINGAPFTVRFVGMDTPETVDPRRPVGCFGKEASNETKSLLTGKTVILQKDISNTDKYKRILRYIYLPLEDGTYLFVNDFLVREGFAKVYTYPPDVKYDQRFKEAEQEAKANNRGMWSACK